MRMLIDYQMMQTIMAMATLLLVTGVALAQPAGANYDESKVPPYTLPDSLVMANGKPVVTASDWTKRRRPELIRLFESQMFGRGPSETAKLDFELLTREDKALDGKAIRKIVSIGMTHNGRKLKAELMLHLPSGSTKPVPVFLALNFGGNHTVHPDPAIPIVTAWVRNNTALGITDHRASERGRGSDASSWRIEEILERGYGVATMYYGDIDPDFDDGFQNGPHPLFYKPGQTRPGPEEWGSIAAWAWGLSRAMDYLESDKDVDARHVALMGHSRLGKAALWAGALDERFAIVISNDSGCGGAALSRRIFGETVERINTAFPHWFADNFKKYNGKENDLPLDQHMLLALIAPRPIYVASAQEDLWADPRGEFLSAVHAGPVYQLLGLEGLGTSEMPGVHQPIMKTIGYHIREGKHDVTLYDWQRYMDFADLHWRSSKSTSGVTK